MTTRAPQETGSRLRRWPLLLAAVTIGAVGLSACGGGGSRSSVAGSNPTQTTSTGSSATPSTCPQHGGALSVGLEATWHPLDPFVGGLAIDDGSVESAIYDTLLTIDTAGKVGPGLATSFTLSPDNLTLTLELRQGVTFQDGTPLDADAVAFNFHRDLDQPKKAIFASYLSAISSVTTSGTSTVALHLKAPFAALPSVLTGFAGMMVSPTAVQKEGASFPQNPVGAGAFQFVSQVAGQSLSLKSNPNYWHSGFPCVDTLNFISIPSGTSRMASLQSGTIQDAENLSYPQIQQAKNAAGINLVHIPGLGTTFAMLETQHAPFDNVDARRAVLYATDFGAINKALYNNLYTPVESSFPPGSWANPGPSVAGYPTYDLAKAKDLVSKLGGLSFTMAIQSGSPDVLQFNEALAAQWQQAGMTVKLVPEDQVTLIDNATNGNFQAMGFRWQGAFDPDLDVYQFFHSGGTLNNVHLSDPTLDALLDQARAGTTQEARKPVYKQIAERLAQDAPYDYEYAADWFRATTPHLKGVPSLGNSWFISASAYLAK